MPTNDELAQQMAALKVLVDSITTPSHSELTNKIATLLQAKQTADNQFRDWLGGAPNGGPNGDGSYPLTDSSGFTRLVPTPALIAAQGRKMVSPGGDIVTSQALTAAHDGQRLRVGGSNNITLSLPNGLPKNWSCLVTRIGTGAVVFAATGGATLLNDQSLDRLRARWSVCTVFVDTVTNNNSQYIASGSMVQG